MCTWEGTSIFVIAAQIVIAKMLIAILWFPFATGKTMCLKTYGDQKFLLCAPFMWNSLLADTGSVTMRIALRKDWRHCFSKKLDINWPSTIGKKMKVFVTSTIDIKLTSTVDIKLMSHIDIYLTIQLDANLMLPNLMYVHEINTRKIIFVCISIHNRFLH